MRRTGMGMVASGAIGAVLIIATPVVALPVLSKADAYHDTLTALRRHFGAAAMSAGMSSHSCTRATREKVRCRVGWALGDGVWDGHVTIWLTLKKDLPSWNYAYKIRFLDDYCHSVEHKSLAACTKYYEIR